MTKTPDLAFADVHDNVVVDNLELDAAGNALAIPLATVARGFGLSLIGNIVDQTAGYPYFLQFFGAFTSCRIGLQQIELADFQRIESALLVDGSTAGQPTAVAAGGWSVRS